MSNELYQDILLDDAAADRVRAYLREVDFRMGEAGPDDFEINRRARYLGYMFQAEDLESFGVGLKCTKPGYEGRNTFIRMSHGQLRGEESAKRLPVNEPVLAAEAMTLNRLYEAEGAAGRGAGGASAGRAPGSGATIGNRRRHGVGTYDSDAGLPGGDMDLSMLEAQLGDIIAFRNGDPVPGDQEILDLKIYWGTLLAGRYPRLKHFERLGRLSDEQAARLGKLESTINSVTDVLESLGLATLETLKTKPKVDG
ncbi:hypothetical protein [uncultured Corynebacterium sp.]|uniref:hypothetical protein n=1 Tax=uncultured Corynebacterium sp. TaxID=159447 RepID=UPI0025DA235D|nr:hypothetical protein [uncultured Corynebacterium sp.]